MLVSKPAIGHDCRPPAPLPFLITNFTKNNSNVAPLRSRPCKWSSRRRLSHSQSSWTAGCWRLLFANRHGVTYQSTWIPFAIPFSIFSVDFLHIDMALLLGVFAAHLLTDTCQISLWAISSLSKLQAYPFICLLPPPPFKTRCTLFLS